MTIEQATKSDTAIRFGISNIPNAEQIENIKELSTLVDVVLEKFPCYTTNVFRSPALNKKIGGAKNSQHMNGEAADIDSVDNKQNLAIFHFIKDHLVFDQLILESPDVNGVPSWVHVSKVRHPKENRGQVLVYLSNKKYIPYGEWQKGMI